MTDINALAREIVQAEEGFSECRIEYGIYHMRTDRALMRLKEAADAVRAALQEGVLGAKQ